MGEKLALSLVRSCKTSQPTATPVHGYLFSQMFVMAVDYHCEAVVCDGSSFQRAHKLQGKQNSLSNLYKFRAKTASGNYCNQFMSDNAGNIRERLHVVNSTRMAAKCTKIILVFHFEICKFVPKLPYIPNSQQTTELTTPEGCETGTTVYSRYPKSLTVSR